MPRLVLPAGLAAVFSALGPAWPTPAGEGLAIAPLAGVVTAAVLAGGWRSTVAALGALLPGAVLAGGAGAEWAVVVAAPLLAGAASHLRRAHAGVAAATSDPLEILGVAAGSSLLAAAMAGATGLPPEWAVAVGLGVLTVAPPLSRLLQILPSPAAPRPAPQQIPHETPGAVPRRRILVVEDDAVNRLVALEILRGAGHAVESAADGPEGLARASGGAEPYDAILLDLHMPGLDGTDVLRRIRALPDPRRARVPVLLLSADVTPAARRRGLEAGADAFLTKPVEADALLRALEAPRSGAPLSELTRGAAVDLELLEGRLGDLGQDALARILGLFQDAAPRHLARLREHAAGGDVTALRREAHTLKGAAAVIGATRVCEAAADIESAAADSTAVAEALGTLDGVIETTLAAVNAFARLRGLPSSRSRTTAVQETSDAKT
ncbi:response regulator [Novispirillum sp. DQ9]|uniref:Hpt domain-containing response regulator n=1 Tax=Novispirillum sp. DQ9 TaxID=3398612 RepID=UPI003C7DA506